MSISNYGSYRQWFSPCSLCSSWIQRNGKGAKAEIGFTILLLCHKSSFSFESCRVFSTRLLPIPACVCVLCVGYRWTRRTCAALDHTSRRPRYPKSLPAILPIAIFFHISSKYRRNKRTSAATRNGYGTISIWPSTSLVIVIW